ncbi:MAG: pseudaminic acid biosynthesis-associated methylase [Nitrososphaera sp.]
MNSPAESNASQRKFWSEDFGENYITRNMTMDEVNKLYEKQTGITVEKIFQKFFSNIDKKSSILELGCNVGLNLSALHKMGFSNLHGVEINKKAIEIAKKNNPTAEFVNSSIEEFDPKGKKYDLVYTAGVLIHINPSALDEIVKKMIDLTREYIFGFEYYSDNLVEVKYRGHSNVCWKQNFPMLFKKMIPSLQTVKEEKFHYKEENLYDIAYLLRKPHDG